MNMNSTETQALAPLVQGQANNASLQTAIQGTLWTVTLLERTGDSSNDPFRTSTGFVDQGRATSFANALKSTCPNCVLLYKGVVLNSLVSGDSSLLELWKGRTGLVSCALDLGEVSDAIDAAGAGTMVADGGSFPTGSDDVV